jgi:uncharacterized delta-60 repeat protein
MKHGVTLLSLFFSLGLFSQTMGLDPTFTAQTSLGLAGNGNTLDKLFSLPNGKLWGMMHSSFGCSCTGNRIGTFRLNADGTIDSTYGVYGYADTYDFAAGWNTPADAVLQPDGKMLIAFSATTYGKTESNSGIVRMNTDGTLDSTFGLNGTNIISLATGYEYLTGIELEPDGQIVVSGYSAAGAGVWEGTLIRFNSNGSIDSTFGTNGAVRTRPGNTASALLLKVHTQPDGKYVTAGMRFNGNDYDFCIARFDTAGQTDSTFNTMGYQVFDYFHGDDYIQQFLIQADGKILLVGNGFNGTTNDYAIMRLNANGTWDSTFSDDGRLFHAGLLYALQDKEDYHYDVIQLPNGKYFAAGSSGIISKGNTLVRYTVDGRIDSTFDGDGIYSENGGQSLPGVENRFLHLTSNGRLVVGSRMDHVFTGPGDIQVKRYLMPLVASFDPVNSVCANKPIQFTNTSEFANSNHWDFGDGDTAVVVNPSHTYTSPGKFYITLKAGNGFSTITYMDSVVIWPLPAAVITRSNDTLSTTAFVSYQWQFNGTDIAAATTSKLIVTQNGSYTVTVTDTNGCSKTSTAFQVSGLGMHANGLHGLTFYPNPFRDELIFKNMGDTRYKVSVYNALGALVMQEELVQGHVSTRDLKPGVYELLLQTGDAYQSYMIIKKGE